MELVRAPDFPKGSGSALWLDKVKGCDQMPPCLAQMRFPPARYVPADARGPSVHGPILSEAPPLRVVAFIDGFNLYHAVDELGKPI